MSWIMHVRNDEKRADGYGVLLLVVALLRNRPGTVAYG
jgi:hypothetical protein